MIRPIAPCAGLESSRNGEANPTSASMPTALAGLIDSERNVADDPTRGECECYVDAETKDGASDTERNSAHKR